MTLNICECCAADLSQEVFPEECSRCVTFQFGASVWGRRPGQLGLTQLVVGPLNPVTTKLWQQDERKGARPPQHLFQRKQNCAHVNTLRDIKMDQLQDIFLPHGHLGMECNPLLSEK